MKLLKMLRLCALKSDNPSKFAVEGSIVPLIDRLETASELQAKKYAPHQLQEIQQALKAKDNRLRAVSYNLRFDCMDHLLEPIHRWPSRLPRALRLLEYLDFDILGVQEPYQNQIQDLLKTLSPTYAFFSKLSSTGEINGVFYRKKRFELLGSHAWAMTSKEKRLDTLTLVQLKDRLTRHSLAVFNTHLSYPNIEKREQQALFISEIIEKWASRMPILLMGDFNSFPNRGDLEGLPFHDGDYIHRLLTRGTIRDARTHSLLGHLGPTGTYTNIGMNPAPFKGYGMPGLFLDHIYISPGVKVLVHAVEPAKVGGQFPSDHMPIITDILLGC